MKPEPRTLDFGKTVSVSNIMTNFHDFYFIIVTYHPEINLLKETLSLLNNWPVVIVDNNHLPKKSLLLHRAKRRNIKIISSGKNLGYAGGANIGIKKALSSRAKWIVILNPDIKINRKCLGLFLKKIRKGNCDMSGPFLGALDDKRWSTIYPIVKTSTRLQTCYLSGAFICYSKEVFEKVGLFNENYFLYYEDVDFFIRAVKKGFLYHHIKLDNIIDYDSSILEKDSFLHQYYLARNHLLFVEKNAPMSVKIFELIRLPKTIWQYLTLKDTGALLGIRDYFLRRFGKIEA